MAVTVRFLGSGDSFGSGGRLQTCILVDTGSVRLLMDAMLPSKRSRPLLVAGPAGTAAHLAQLREALFPGSRVMSPAFPYRVVELRQESRTAFEGFTVTVYPALHTPETNPLVLRVECAGRVIAFSGDTEWTAALAKAAAGADLLILECYFHDKPVKMHMNYAALAAHRSQIEARRIVLTHMSTEMLARVGTVAEQCAFDGLTLEL